MESRFEDFKQSPVFENMVSYLKYKLDQLKILMNLVIKKLRQQTISEIYYQKNGCNLNVINEWQVLKTFMVPLINNNKNSTYLELWKRVFLNIKTKKECCNMLHIFKLLLVIPFTNAKLERMFSRMLHV